MFNDPFNNDTGLSNQLDSDSFGNFNDSFNEPPIFGHDPEPGGYISQDKVDIVADTFPGYIPDRQRTYNTVNMDRHSGDAGLLRGILNWLGSWW